MKLTIILFGIILGISSCTYYVIPPMINKKTETEYFYISNKNFKKSKWRKTRRKIGYECFDKKRNVIKEVEYGEKWSMKSETLNSDSSITINCMHGRNYKKINTVLFHVYDNTGNKSNEELWQFKNNKMDYLIYKTIFEYDTNGKLIKETEYDKDNKVSRLQDYSNESKSKTISNDSVLNFSYEGIIRVKGKSLDTIVNDISGRPIKKTHYYNDRFLYREEFRYDRSGQIVTELRYDDKPDSLWCITEWQYNYDKRPTRKFWKVIGSTTETKDIYIYNNKKLLDKILHYSGDELKGYTKYKYILY